MLKGGGGGHHFMTLSVSGTWGISEEFNLHLTGEKSEFFIFGFLRSCQEKFANSSRKILVSVYGVLVRFAFYKIKSFQISVPLALILQV